MAPVRFSILAITLGAGVMIFKLRFLPSFASSAPCMFLYVLFVRVCCLCSQVWPDLRAGKR